jgi:transposase-like protein
MTKTEGKPAIAAVNELFAKSPDGLREIVRAVMQEMLEAEMTDALGAEKGERTVARLGYRSGDYSRTLVTRVGKLELRVPQDRDGRFSPDRFQPPAGSSRQSDRPCDHAVDVGRVDVAEDEEQHGHHWKNALRPTRVTNSPSSIRSKTP